MLLLVLDNLHCFLDLQFVGRWHPVAEDRFHARIAVTDPFHEFALIAAIDSLKVGLAKGVREPKPVPFRCHASEGYIDPLTRVSLQEPPLLRLKTERVEREQLN